MGGQLFAGRYRIVRRLAQGGMGVVFVAEHAATEGQVALKVLWPHVLGSKSAVSGFEQEARLNARIDSEHVVRVLDAGVDERGVPFFAMELLRGVTLRALVAETGPLAPAEAIAVLRQAARALDKAHGYVDRDGQPAPIVHRDLKPENLFAALRESGEAIVKVLDFGLAKVLSQDQPSSHEIKGTPAFMACEQFARGPITPQLDVWAFGLLAFYLLAGRVYWLSSTQNTPEFTPLLGEILLQPLAPPTDRALALGLTPPWPTGFDAWFLRCLEREPSARFASAGAAIEALSEIFVAGAGLSEATIAAAPAAIARKIAVVLEKSEEASAPAQATLPEVSSELSSLDPIEAAGLLGPVPSGLLPAPHGPTSGPLGLASTAPGLVSAALGPISPPPPKESEVGKTSAPPSASPPPATPSLDLPPPATLSLDLPPPATPSIAPAPSSGARVSARGPRSWAAVSAVVAFAVLSIIALQGGLKPGETTTSGAASAPGASAATAPNPFLSPTPPAELAQHTPPTATAEAGGRVVGPVGGSEGGPTAEVASTLRPPKPRLPQQTPDKTRIPEKDADAGHVSEGGPKPRPIGSAPTRDPRNSTWVPPRPGDDG